MIRSKATIRERLHRFIDNTEEKNLKAIYTILEDKIEAEEDIYTDEFKAELDRRYEDYKTNGNTVSEEEVHNEITKLLQKTA